MAKTEISYNIIQEMRDNLIDELKASTPSITIDVLKLVEMRVQTALMAGVTNKSLEASVRADKEKLNHE